MNENQYVTGDHVSVRGSGFDANESGTWMIEGVSGSDKGDTIAGPTALQADGGGAFCVDAYTVLPGDDGVYKVTALGKTDNYTVDEAAEPTPTPTPTPSPTPTPDSSGTPDPSGDLNAGSDQASPPPTDRVAGSAATTEGLGLVVMAIGGVLASVMVLTPARVRRR